LLEKPNRSFEQNRNEKRGVWKRRKKRFEKNVRIAF